MKTSLQSSLISGQGLVTFLLRLLFLPLYVLYALVSAARNALYDTGLLTPTAVDVPVVSVGNVTTGGTGKTPLVIALAKLYLAEGRKVAIVSRGYGAPADDEGLADEVVLTRQQVPEAMLVVAPDKLLAARQAVEQGAEVILVDDGFQHRRLQRDLDVVVLDARAPLGNGQVLPYGPLREHPGALARADLVIATHHEGLSTERLEQVRIAIAGNAGGKSIPVVWGRHRPVGVRAVGASELQPEELLEGQEVHLFCGIASPEGFRETVESLGAVVTGVTAFGDHHAFDGADLASVRAAAGTSRLLCTEKDAVKIARIPGNEDVLCLAVELELLGELPDLPGLDAE